MKFESTLDGLIECLQAIRQHASGDTPISINLISERNVALKSIYYDHNVGGEETIYIEGDTDDRAESSANFSLLDTTDMFNKIEKATKDEPIAYQSFIDDIDKMYDLMNLDLNKKGFLAFYSYMNEKEYDLTMADIKPLKSENDMSDHNQQVVENVADLMRQAENMHIEDMNDRPNGWNVSGEDLKYRIADFVSEYFTDEQVELFRELCNSMGV